MNKTNDAPARATITFNTSPEVKDRLDQLATITNRSKSYLTNVAVQQYLAAEEQFITSVQAGIADAEAGRSYSTPEALVSLKKRIKARAGAKA